MDEISIQSVFIAIQLGADKSEWEEFVIALYRTRGGQRISDITLLFTLR